MEISRYTRVNRKNSYSFRGSEKARPADTVIQDDSDKKYVRAIKFTLMMLVLSIQQQFLVDIDAALSRHIIYR